MTVDNRVRHAIILGAGMGSRLKPYTDDRPKPLVEVNGIPILIRALGNLAAVGVEEVTIVVGYRQDDIRSLVGDRFGTIAIRSIEAPDYATTGSAWSLWLAREALKASDVFLLEADVIFETAVLRRLLQHAARDVAAVSRFWATMQGSAVVVGPNDRILEMRTRQDASNLKLNGPTLYKTVNIYRLSQETAAHHFVPALEAMALTQQRQVFTEQTLQGLLTDPEFNLTAARCDDLKWFEIDTVEDLRAAETLFAPDHRENS